MEQLSRKDRVNCFEVYELLIERKTRLELCWPVFLWGFPVGRKTVAAGKLFGFELLCGRGCVREHCDRVEIAAVTSTNQPAFVDLYRPIIKLPFDLGCRLTIRVDLRDKLNPLVIMGFGVVAAIADSPRGEDHVSDLVGYDLFEKRPEVMEQEERLEPDLSNTMDIAIDGHRRNLGSRVFSEQGVKPKIYPRAFKREFEQAQKPINLKGHFDLARCLAVVLMDG